MDDRSVEEKSLSGKLLTAEEVEEARGIKANNLNQRRFYGSGPKYLKVGRLVFYELAEVDKWLASCRRVPGSEGKDRS